MGDYQDGQKVLQELGDISAGPWRLCIIWMGNEFKEEFLRDWGQLKMIKWAYVWSKKTSKDSEFHIGLAATK